jgi:hypothetical protein
MKSLVVVGCLLLVPASALAEGKAHRELGAHEHGHGSFNIAIDGGRLVMELQAPGADIVGFEHKASTKAQRQAVAKAKKALGQLDKVVVLPAAAGCKLEDVKVELHIEDAAHGGSHGEAKAKNKKSGHDHHHGHGHSHGKKGEADNTHSEFHATYALTCAAPDKIAEISFPYFKNFKGARELDVNVVGASAQKNFEVTRSNAKIALGGVI